MIARVAAVTLAPVAVPAAALQAVPVPCKRACVEDLNGRGLTLDMLWTDAVLPAQRKLRQELAQIANHYFEAVGTSVPYHSDPGSGR